jgi:hypothetical protein
MMFLIDSCGLVTLGDSSRGSDNLWLLLRDTHDLYAKNMPKNG